MRIELRSLGHKTRAIVSSKCVPQLLSTIDSSYVALRNIARHKQLDILKNLIIMSAARAYKLNLLPMKICLKKFSHQKVFQNFHSVKVAHQNLKKI